MKKQLKNKYLKTLAPDVKYNFEDRVRSYIDSEIQQNDTYREQYDEIMSSPDHQKVRDSKGNWVPKGIVEQIAADDASFVKDCIDGLITGRSDYSIKDAMFSKDYPELFLNATSIFLANNIFPAMVVTENLFDQIPYNGDAESITIRTIGGTRIYEVAEGAEYPETGSAVNDQAYRMHFEMKKYGAKVGATREMISSDNWGILAATLVDMRKKMDLIREDMNTKMLINEAGFVMMDNANPDLSELGTTSGRGIDGAQNGTLGVDDIYEIFAHQQMRGIYIDTIIIHPFAWSLWARDPEMQEGLLGSNVVYMPGGSAAKGWGGIFGPYGPDFSKYGGDAAGATNPGVSELYNKLGVGSSYEFPQLTAMGATFKVNPKYCPVTKIIVSPYVPYSKISKDDIPQSEDKYATDIIFADSNKGGVELIKETPNMESWGDVEREIEYIKIRAKWGKALKDQGRGICVAKNVIMDRTYAFSISATVNNIAERTRKTKIISRN